MSSRLFRRRIRASLAPCAVGLSFVLLLPAAFADTASWTSSLPASPATNNQAGALQNVGSANNTAAMLGQAAGVLSMAAGGLYMAKGAQELACCAQGCNTGAGTNANKSKADQDAANAANATKVQTAAGTSASQTPSILSSLTSSSATGCLDGAISLATGGVMMLSGIMGLQAANQAAQNGSTALSSSTGMGSMPPLGGTSPTGSSGSSKDGSTSGAGGTASSSIGGGKVSTGGVKLDPALLHTGTANGILGQFENRFGIPRDSFAQQVLGGQDPRKLLGAAPQSPLSQADMGKALSMAEKLSAADRAKLLEGTKLAAAQKELAGQVGDGDDLRLAGGLKGRSPSSSSSGAEEADPGAAVDSAAAGISLSPEVEAALAARQAEEASAAHKDTEAMTLFERVHWRYRERSKWIFGFDPDAVWKGTSSDKKRK